jgi:hypothetical protein
MREESKEEEDALTTANLSVVSCLPYISAQVFRIAAKALDSPHISALSLRLVTFWFS